MKRLNIVFSTGFVLIFAVSLIVSSCKKEDSEDTGPVDISPSLTFLTGTEYVSSNVSLEIEKTFKVGVLGSKNPNTNIDIATFSVVRTFNSITETVYENNSVGESYLSWESTEMTNAMVGEEKWSFSIMDYTGETKEILFVILTTSPTPYTPILTATYQVINYAGDELLDFFLTCETDDWELVKVVATYPGGGGSDAFIGNGEITPEGAPYNLPSYFTKLGGTWTFHILGYIKSGSHTGESFSVYTTVTVVG